MRHHEIFVNCHMVVVYSVLYRLRGMRCIHARICGFIECFIHYIVLWWAIVWDHPAVSIQWYKSFMIKIQDQKQIEFSEAVKLLCHGDHQRTGTNLKPFTFGKQQFVQSKVHWFENFFVTHYCASSVIWFPILPWYSSVTSRLNCDVILLSVISSYNTCDKSPCMCFRLKTSLFNNNTTCLYGFNYAKSTYV